MAVRTQSCWLPGSRPARNCARAVPARLAVSRSCNDRLPHLLVIATDQHEGSIRANLREERMNRLLIRSDVRLVGAALADCSYRRAASR